MKKLLTIVFLVAFITAAYNQNINFNWVQQLNRKIGLPFDESYFIGTDSLQNVYVAGNFHFTIDLDPGIGITNVSSEFDNIFVCKFNASGNFIWGRHLGQNDKYTVCKSLFVDASGNIYTTGYFIGEADFDPGPAEYNLISTTSVNAESNDIFISKLDANGNFQWAKQIGNSSIDYGTSVTVDIFGNVYTTGYFTGVVDLDPGPGSDTRGSRDVGNGFIVKLNAAGRFKYSRVFEGNHYSVGKFIRTDARGNVYTSGYFDGDVDFDPGPAVRNFTTEVFAQKNFLLKLDSSGNYIWAIRDITGLDIAADDFENVYTYSSELTKYDINGNLVWKKQIGGGPNSIFAHADVKVDSRGNIYLTGSFRSLQDFDPGPAEYMLTTLGGEYASDVFVSKLTTDGNLVWAASFGGSLEDYATSLAIDNAGNVYTAGVFNGNVDFDPGGENYTLTSASGGNVFVHKMSPCKNALPVTLYITDCKSYTMNNVTYKSSGIYTQVLKTTTGTCDSIIYLDLQITGSTTNMQITTCDSYMFHNKLLTASGVYNDTLQSKDGCDSIVQIDLIINRSATSVNAVICSGQDYAGHTVAGIFNDTLHTSNGCDSIVTVHLSLLAKLVPDLGHDLAICPGDSISLVPGYYQSYLWQDGSVIPTYTVKRGGTYAVTVSNACGEGHDEITVTESPCEMYFPTAFTPNNDGKNERFTLLNPHEVSDFHLSVYNRYGQLVFQTNEHAAGWTGMYKGVPAQAGTYAWYCRFRKAGVAIDLKGTVVLFR